MKLHLALTDKDEAAVYRVLDVAIGALERYFKPKLTSLLTDVVDASGTAAAKVLKQQLRSAVSRELAPKTTFAFDKTNPRAVQWVKDHALETIDVMAETTRDSVRTLIEESFAGEFDVHDLADEISKLVGDDNRAEVIARTETMTASNRGQQELWDQAVDADLLNGTELQVWIVTPDDRLCPICEPLEDVTAPLGGTFNVDGVEIDGPPAHPQCRCTLGLTL